VHHSARIVRQDRCGAWDRNLRHQCRELALYAVHPHAIATRYIESRPIEPVNSRNRDRALQQFPPTVTWNKDGVLLYDASSNNIRRERFAPFYHHPKTLDDIINQSVNKALDQFDLGVELDLFSRWTGTEERSRAKSQ
jgi:hypothetical protein